MWRPAHFIDDNGSHYWEHRPYFMFKVRMTYILFTRMYKYAWSISRTIARLILGLRPANERRRYKVTPSLIGWAQT